MDSFTKKIIISLILSTFIISFCRATDPLINMIREGHYPVEKHTVTTKDGYILTVHRLPRPNVKPENRKVILMLHGFADCAGAFVNRGQQKSFAFQLFETGYEIWLLNSRGNIFSQRHTKLNSTDPKYWQFSWHEIGVFDLPATIDYILSHTNQTKLAFIGVSQGSTALLILLSELPDEYNHKISIAHLMTPVAIFKNNKTPFPRSIEFVNALSNLLEYGGVNDVTPHSIASSLETIGHLCSFPIGRELCKNVMFGLFGPSLQYFDTMIPTMADHYPSGASSRTFIHYIQIIATGKFQKFRFNETKNMEIYGTIEPPEYDLSKINTKIHILYGIHDNLAPTDNIIVLAEKLGSNVVALDKFSGYNHIDFIYGRNLKPVHKKILKTLENYY